MQRELGFTSRRVWDSLDDTPATISDLAERTGMSICQISGAVRTLLTRPELRHKITCSFITLNGRKVHAWSRAPARRAELAAGTPHAAPAYREAPQLGP